MSPAFVAETVKATRVAFYRAVLSGATRYPKRLFVAAQCEPNHCGFIVGLALTARNPHHSD